MYVARVVGRVWATRKSPGLENTRLLVVRAMNGNPPVVYGEPVLAVCAGIDAGPGDIVLVLDEGGSARTVLKSKNAPVRTIVVGVIDEMEIRDRLYRMNADSSERRS
ncbi:EutN/CcmL family microcompartment protein [bacterium]|nr:EutN/CcmL family microcompartment protein [candidate division CSSED10-310 bacterium]